PVIVRCQILEPLDLAREKAPPQGAIRHEADAQLSAGWEHLVFGITRPQGIFSLKRRDGMGGMSPANGLWPCLRKPEKTHLPLAHKIRHGSHGLLNGRVRVHAVLVVEINAPDTETAQAGLTSGANVFRSAIDPTYIDIGTSDNAELGGQNHLVAAPPNRSPDHIRIP